MNYSNRAEELKEVIANLYDLPRSQLATDWEVIDGVFSCRVIDLVSKQEYQFTESRGFVINARCF